MCGNTQKRPSIFEVTGDAGGDRSGTVHASDVVEGGLGVLGGEKGAEHEGGKMYENVIAVCASIIENFATILIIFCLIGTKGYTINVEHWTKLCRSFSNLKIYLMRGEDHTIWTRSKIDWKKKDWPVIFYGRRWLVLIDLSHLLQNPASKLELQVRRAWNVGVKGRKLISQGHLPA